MTKCDCYTRWKSIYNYRKCTHCTIREFLKLFQKILLMVMGHPPGKKNPHYHSLPCVLLLQRKPHLRSATVGLLSLPSDTANLHTIAKALTLMHPSIDKSKCLTHLRCTVIKTNQILK